MSSPSVRWHHLKVRQSIRTRWLVLLLGLTTVSVLTVGYLGVNSVQSVGESAQQISAEALRVQAEEYLRQVTVGDAQKNDLILKRSQRDAENVAQYAASIFERPDVFTGGTYWQAENHMLTGPDGQYMSYETDVSDAFVPNLVNIDDELLTVLELGAYLDFILVPTYESDPNTVAIYLGTERDVLRYYPNINIGTIVPPDFQVTQRPWYVSATPENNPERKVVWSPVYVDATGKGLMVTAAAPVYTGRDELVGVVGIDVTLKDIGASVEATRLLGSGYSFLVDETGHAIALPEHGYPDVLGRPAGPGEVGADLSEVTTGFAPILVKMMAGSTGFDTLEVGGRELFVAYAPLESIGWSLANVVEAGEVLQPMVTLQGELETATGSLVLARILPLGGGILAVVVVVGLLLTNRLVDPIQRLATAAQQIGAGRWDAPLPQAGNDEIGVLSQAFATMAVRLHGLMEGLEQRVAERTADLERRAVQLQAAAEVARDATAVRDVGQLLDETVHLISERFGFYHAGVFLVDDAREYAILRAASSEGGHRMLARGHKLAVGKVGMVGYVTSTGEPRIALDVGEDAVHFVNPDLPETRSEMTLPLRVRGEVIGALDVQSIEEAAFSDEDVAVLQTMADQLAVAIENARLLRETQDRLRELSLLHREYSAAAWAQLTPLEHPLGYVYDRVDVAPMEQLVAPALDLALQRGEPIALVEPGAAEAALAMPLKLRDQVIGVLGLQEMDEAREWSPDEIALVEAVSEQVALALENARLFEEIQRTAERLKEVDRLKSQFLANMSHELRTPLNSIIGFSRVILKGIDGPLTDTQRTDLQAIYESGQHLLGLINDILDISKIEAGKMELTFESVDMDEIIKGVMSTAVALVKDKPIKLQQSISPGLPTVRGDARRIREVLINLLSNAAKFTEQGFIRVEAQATPRLEGGQGRGVIVAVADSGIGIPPEKIDTIFEPFTQVDASSTRSAGGTGLGLSISKHFVEMHGGRIWVESTLGEGSTFYFSLPVEQPSSPLVKQGPEDGLEQPEPEPRQRLVLCVDDDAGVITLFRRYLSKQGYRVVGLTDSTAAVERARQLKPFAITLDVLMPDKDGWQVVQELKADPETRHIPVIMCTILSKEKRGLSLGASDYLVKPIMEQELLAALERLDREAGRHRVLVVDDQPEDRSLLRRMIEGQEEYEVVEAASGQEAIALVRQARPDVIVLDLLMPDVDGFAVLEAVKADEVTRSIPIIVVTAKDLSQEERDTLNSRVEALLQKGLCDQQELLAEVAEALGRLGVSS